MTEAELENATLAWLAALGWQTGLGWADVARNDARDRCRRQCRRHAEDKAAMAREPRGGEG